MAYLQVLNTLPALTPSDQVLMIKEFNALRAELDDIRSALAATRALLVAGTAVGAGYNVASTNIGPAITATPGQAPRFNATLPSA
jgi:hypothetical protein